MRPKVWMPAGLWLVGWRYLARHRWQSLLMVLGIALGVAVMVAIDLANASASRAFELSTEAVVGRATHQIRGGPEGMDEEIYVRLRRAGLGIPLAPVVSETVFSETLGNRPLQLLGVDSFAEAPFRSYVSAGGALPVEALSTFFLQPRTVLLLRESADRYGLGVGDRFRVEVAGRQTEMVIAGLLDPPDALTRRALDGVLLADIATAQEVTGRLGRLDSIELIVPEGQTAVLTQVAGMLPAGMRLGPVAERSQAVEQMTAAFQLNLSALSLLALVVGLFLIYNTMTFSVVQRRELFGTLRCLGTTRREVFWMVLSEGVTVGVLGAGLGMLLGVWMGRQTVGMVTQTINDLYFATTVREVGVPAASLVKGGVIGILATTAAALLPAWEAASVAPRLALSRSGLESKARRAVVWTSLAGVGAMLLGVGAFQLPGNSILTGFGGLTAVLVGFALLAAISLVGLMRAAAPLLGRLSGFLGQMAPRNLVNALSRTSVAVAALMVAVAVTIGMTLMIDSFRHTVQVWLASTLMGDVYVSVPSTTGTTPMTALDPQVVETARNWPGVERMYVTRSTILDGEQGNVHVSAMDNAGIENERYYQTLFVPRGQLWQAMQAGSVAVSEPLARRLGLMEAGTALRLNTRQGWVAFPVAAVFYDYANSEGSLLMSRAVYQRYWSDESVTALDLRLGAGVEADGWARELQSALGGQQRLLVRSNQTLRADVLAVFDRTFAITLALRLLATVVAFIGVLNTLLLLQFEKQREVGILRALGLSGGQLWKLVMLETGLMGMTAGLLAMPTGYALALVLVYVINQRSFGWTLQLDIRPEAFLTAFGWALLAALLAGILPAYRLGRMPAAEVIRYE